MQDRNHKQLPNDSIPAWSQCIDTSSEVTTICCELEEESYPSENMFDLTTALDKDLKKLNQLASWPESLYQVNIHA